VANFVSLKLDHPLIKACKELFPGRLQYSWPAELRMTESGFTVSATLPETRHFGIVRLDFAARGASFYDYDAYDGNESLIDQIELTAQQIDELKEHLRSAAG